MLSPAPLAHRELETSSFWSFWPTWALLVLPRLDGAAGEEKQGDRLWRTKSMPTHKMTNYKAISVRCWVELSGRGPCTSIQHFPAGQLLRDGWSKTEAPLGQGTCHRNQAPSPPPAHPRNRFQPPCPSPLSLCTPAAIPRAHSPQTLPPAPTSPPTTTSTRPAGEREAEGRQTASTLLRWGFLVMS